MNTLVYSLVIMMALVIAATMITASPLMQLVGVCMLGIDAAVIVLLLTSTPVSPASLQQITDAKMYHSIEYYGGVNGADLDELWGNSPDYDDEGYASVPTSWERITNSIIKVDGVVI
jgi:hypothetical protein